MLIIHLLKALLKLLAWIEGKLPDRPRLAVKLLLIGGGLLLPLAFPSLFDDSGFGGAVLALNLVVGGFLCLLTGCYILFRRGTWKWQEKRAKKFISLNLK